MSVKQYFNRKTLKQFLSYALIGLLTNGVGYICYLLITHFWSTPKLTMTVLYSIGALISFMANRQLTFKHDGHIGAAGTRYIVIQILGYSLNLLLLVLFVDLLGFSHQLIQGMAVLIVAVFLYVLSRSFVFPTHSTKDKVSL